MNETGLSRAIKALLEDNKDDLVSELSQQGSARKFEQISRSTLTIPAKFYFASIEIAALNESEPGFESAASPPGRNIYQVNVYLGDQAVPQPQGEDQPYELSHDNFRTFTGAVKDLIQQAEDFTDPDTGDTYRFPRTRSNDRPINVFNRAKWLESANGLLPGLGSTLSFRLEDWRSDG